MRRHRKTAYAGIAALAVALLAAAGCSSSSSSSSSTTPPATSAAAAPSPSGTTGGLGAQSVTNYLTYTGGKSGPANTSLTPVTIGFVNQQGGPQVIGQHATDGAEMAVKYINAQLGGVDGHPIVLDTCFIASAEEEGTGCAQKFLANKNVHVAAMGAAVIGVQSFYSTLGGAIPVVGGVAALGIDGAQKNTAVLFGDATSVLGPMGTYGKDVLHAKTAVILYPDTASATPGALATEAGLKAAGISVKMGPYPETTTDLTGVLASTGAASADMVIPAVAAPDCVNIQKALTQQGITDPKKIVAAPLCLNGQVAAALGGDFPKWTYLIASSLFGDTTDPGMIEYMKLAQTYSTPANAPDPWNIVDFGQMMTIDKVLNQVGYANLTPAAILSAVKAFKGPQALGAPQLECGYDPSAPGVCNNRSQFFEYAGHNKWIKTAGWTQPPAGD
ncbi:MAG: ABC transporter substrate-binding protein [Trebonia sp.]|uniref:ABC transporter substrate-binding protein n=1 Tax=Trebonia sp. TaxID=2767075 RepID=UPI003BAE87B6